jgi:hypothetical protein
MRTLYFDRSSWSYYTYSIVEVLVFKEILKFWKIELGSFMLKIKHTMIGM